MFARPPGRGAFALLVLSLSVSCSQPEAPPPPPLEIPVVEAIQRDQEIQLDLVGATRGSRDIPIRARVEGELEGLHFREGGKVEAGDLLYTIDPQPFEAEVVEARGHLAEARTRFAKARSDLDRIRPLAEMKAVSEVDLDGAVAQFEAARGSVQSAEARLEQAQIRLGYTRIHSPIAGRIGLSKAQEGEFVGRSPNPVVLNFVSETDPIRVRFAIDEQRYLRFARAIAALNGQAPEGERNELRLILADGTIHEHPGRAVAYDAAVDPGTGTFTIEADFPNPEDLVLSGQFARVRATVEHRKGAILVPQRCLSELQGNFRVFVVDDEGRVSIRTVEAGPKVDRLQIIESGLEPGERVAFEGLSRLRDGMVVAPTLVALDATGAPITSEERTDS